MTIKHVSVCFQLQESAWCDELVMIQWVRHHWKPHIEGPTMLLLDQHKAQRHHLMKVCYP